MKKLVAILFALLLSSELYSQPWINLLPKEKSDKQDINFYELQKAFHKYWEGKNLKNKHITKGKGYKQFKRWEEYMIPRVYPGGFFPANQSWNEFQKEKKKNTLKSTPVSNWNFIGPPTVPLNNAGIPSGVGRINCVAFHPANSNVIFAGAPSGGFWKSTDGGANWVTTTDELPSIGISDIAINQANPDIIYIATGDGDASDTYSIGVLKSTDGGASWNATGLSWTTDNKLIIRRLLINPNNSSVLIAATTIGLFRSIDSGDNWSKVQSGHFKDLEFNPSNPDIVYAARFGPNSAKFYKSIDGGASFTEISTGVNLSETYRIELAISAADANVVYALYSDNVQDGFHSLWKSSNAGDNWAKIYDAKGLNLLGWEKDGSDIGGQGWYDLALAVSPTDASVVYVGGINIWKSVNSGTDWSLVCHWEGDTAPYVHADHHSLNFSPSGVLYSGNDGGLYKTINGGTSWTDISNGLQILQIDRIGISQHSANISMLGNQDNGSMKYDASANNWVQVFGGDGGECFVDYSDDKVIYASAVNGDLRKSVNGGVGFVSVKPDGAGEGAWHTPFVINPTDNEILYAGYEDVWKTTNRGSSWQKISNNLSAGKPLTQISVAPSNSDYIYVTNGERIWITKNGGASWTEVLSPELTGLYITYFAIADNNPEKAWVTVSGFVSGKKVFQTENAGTSWTNISEGLPNVPVNCIIHENVSYDVLYLGCDIGVYYLDAAQSSWQNFSSHLPVVEISELEIQYSASKLVAGTRGRGLWETGIQLSAPNAPRLVKAITSDDGTKVELIFNKNMSNPAGKETEFTINNGTDIQPLSIAYKDGMQNVYILTLPIIVSQGEILKISYTKGSVLSVDDEPLASFIYSRIMNIVGVEVLNIDQSKDIVVFPNPNSGQFDIQFKKLLAPNITLKLINLSGQIVYNESLMISHLGFQYHIKTNNLAKGAYLLIIDTRKVKYQKTIVIE